MSRIDANANASSLYDQVTSRIIAELEAGRLPWVQPWDAAGLSAGLPRNAGTGRCYSGINVLILWSTVIERGYGHQAWLTYRQAEALGGYVRTGEQGETVCYADRFTPKDEQERAATAGDEARQIAFLKRFTVFNVDQCEGLPDVLPGIVAPLPGRQVIPHAEALIDATGADFRIGGDRAFYAPEPDFVQVPLPQLYRVPIDFYRTAFHELGHWTGHASRLGRDQSGRFGDAFYAREELVAEMTSAFVCAELSIEPKARHSDYIGSWLEVLREDNRAIFRAASQASKAVDFLLAFRGEAGAGEVS
ncbi:ArdC family protein [Sphingomonas sp. PR090111-T3T-6A]|uniref:ArdC family protein n=1 Tax=Sphingomonas sp. PR090111-T3T-6A TaxID=685778 RepID=UPI00037B0E82|nr:zincin-like metallopeptidase domain-containing protein [Sphingomonas sp. PR090111-T3T-6A]